MGNSQTTVDAQTMSDSSSASQTYGSSSSKPLCPRTLLSQLRSEIDTIDSKTCQTEYEKLRLKELKNMAYDVEDIISDLDADDDGIDRGMLENRIQRISSKRKDEAKREKALKFRKADGKRRKTAEQQGRQPTGPLPSDSQIYGRGDIMDEIIDFITDEKRKGFIVTVVGAAGIGKTALVQHIFNHEKIKTTFQRFGWVFVRNNYDELMLTKAVYESLTRKASSSNELQRAQNELGEELEGKKCFLVLDDVWNAGKEFWCRFWNPLAPKLEESVVLVTTRSFLVEGNMPQEMCVERFIVTPLDEDASRKLFSASVEGRHVASEWESREEINRCSGIPAFLKSAASVAVTGLEWKYGDGLQGDSSDIKASYCRLRAPLKRCIAYCTLFTEDHIFSQDSLVRLWIAEGFVQPNGGEELEKIGEEYFDELCCQSFFLYISEGQFRMPMNRLLFEESLRIDYCSSTSNHTDYRHLSYAVDGQHMVEWKQKGQASKLRTFIICPKYHPKKDGLTYLKIDLSALPKLEYLRVLDLSYTELKEVPMSVIQLSRHLHFLGLSGTKIRRLPQCSCTGSHNLQTLKLKDCCRLEELPEDIRDMRKLRHLEMSNDTNLCMPAGLGDLTELQTLPIFNVGRAEGFAGIRELKNLRKLTGDLCISGLCNVANYSDCEEADLANKESIEKLTLAWPLPEMIVLDDEEFNDDLVSPNETYGKESNLENVESTSEAPNARWDEEGDRRGTNPMAVDNASIGTQEVSIRNPISSFMPEENNNTIPFMLNSMETTVEESDEHSSFRDVPQDDSDKNQIFEKLRPHKKLQVLVVKSYDGTAFPKWMADDSFEVKKLFLENCKKCVTLPALGGLPLLEELVINLMEVESIGSEFDRSSGTKSSFPNLRELIFNELYKLRSWTDVTENDFPELKTFTCFNCPMLEQIPNFASLRELKVENCGALRSLPMLPELKTLRLVACDGLKELPNFEKLGDLSVSYCSALEMLPKLPSLDKKLWLEDCDNLKSVGFLGETDMERKDKLERFSSLFVINCPQLGFSAHIRPQNDDSELIYVDGKGEVEKLSIKNRQTRE